MNNLVGLIETMARSPRDGAVNTLAEEIDSYGCNNAEI